MTKAQNIKFLMSLGISKEKAEKMSIGIIDTAAEMPETELNEISDSVLSHQSELYVNSQAYKDNIKAVKDRALAEVHTKAEKKIKQIAGLTDEEIKDKKYDEIVELAWKKSSSNMDKTAASIQEELTKVSEKLKNYEEVEIPKIRSEVESEKLRFKSDTALSKKIAALKIRQGVEHDDLLLMVKLKAEKLGYKAEIDDSGDIIFKNADGTKILSQDKKNFVPTADIINTFLDPFIDKTNVSQTSKESIMIDKEKQTDKSVKGNQGTAVNAAIEKAQKHAEALRSQEKV